MTQHDHKRAIARFAIVGAVCIGAGACAFDEKSNDRLEENQAAHAEAAAGRGLAYAEEACADCHAVRAGEAPSPEFAAPTFEAIANSPGMTGIAFSAWMQTSHPTMPNLIIDPQRLEDLWLYIATLKSEED